MFCLECGSQRPDIHNFCTSCGNALCTQTCVATSKYGLAFLGVLSLLVGFIFVVWCTLWILGLLTVNGKSQATLEDYPLVGLGLALGGGACYLGLKHLLRLAHTITVEDTEEIVLHYVLGSTRLAIGDIRSIQERAARIAFEGHDSRELHLYHANGVCRIPHFSGAERLIVGLRALNPTINADITGAGTEK